MAKADGQVLISLDVQDNTKEPINKMEARLKDVGKGAGDQLDDSMKSNATKAEETAKKASNVIEGDFKKPVIKKLDVKADQAKKEISSIDERTAKLVKGDNSVKFKVTGNASDKVKQIYEGTEKVTKGDNDVVINEKGNAKQKTDEVSESLDNAKEKSLKLKDVISGTFIGGALTSGIGVATSAISGLVGEAVNASDAIDKFKSTMQLGGFGEKDINSATKEVQKYANETVYDLNTVSNTTAQLAANGIKNYTQLTEAAGNLNAQAGGNADTFRSVAMMLTQTAGAGKLTTENWNQLADAIPGASGVLQEQMKKNKAFTGNFRDAMAAGKISSQEFSKAITQLGMNDGAKKAAKSTTTFEGAIGNMEAGVVTGIQNIITKIGKQGMTGAINTASALITGLFGAIAGLLSIISKGGSVLATFGDMFGETFKQAKIMFGEFAKSIGGNAFDRIGKSFETLSKAMKPVMAQLGGILGVIGAGAWNFFAGVVKGIAGQFKNLGSTFKSTGINNFLGDMMGYVAKLTSKMAPLGKAIGSVIGAIAKSLGGDVAKIIGAFGKTIDSVLNTKSSGGFVKTLTSLLNGFAKNKIAVKIVSDSLIGLMGAKMITGGIGSAAGAISNIAEGLGNIAVKSGGLKSLLGKMTGLSKLKAVGSSLTENAWYAGTATKEKAISVGKKTSEIVTTVKDNTQAGITKALAHVHSFNKSAGKILSNVKAVVKDTTSKGLSLAKRTITRMGKGIAKGLTWTARIITKGAQLALKGLQKVMSVTVGGVKKLALAMKANPWTIWVTAIVAVIAVLVALYKHNKKFRNFVNGIIKSAKNMAKSVGKWFKSMYNDVVKIVKNLAKAVTKRFGNLWKDSKDIFKNGTKTIRSVINIFYDFFTGKWSKLGKDIKKLSSNMWKLVKSIFRGAYDYLNDLTGGRLDKMVKALSRFGQSFERGFRNIGKAVGRIWSGVWKTVKGLAEDGINAVIGVINAGINGIDGVIHAFGGKKHAVGRIGKVHFATGTGSLTSNFRRSIDRMTPAVVNDRPGARNPELIYRHATGNIEWMKGRNAETMLMPGDEVANDHDSAMLAPMLGIKHFAKGGIGNIFSGIGSFVKGAVSTVSKGAKWLKNLFKTATNIIGHPVKSLEELFKYKKAGKGIFKDLGKNMFSAVKDKAVDWWKSLWSMVDLNGSGVSGSVAHTPGAGWKVTSGFGSRGATSGGFSSHDGVDFSGASLVRAMLPGIVSGYGGAPSGWGGGNGIGEYVATRGLYNAIYQELNGKSNSGAKILVKKGESVKAGDPIAKLGPQASHVHVGVTKHPMFSIGGSSTNGWLDVTKLKSTGSDKSSKKSKGDNNTIKKQVGSGFWKLISKIANMFGDASGSGDISGGAITRAMIAKAEKVMHVPTSIRSRIANDILKVANSESGNRSVMQSIHDMNSGGNEARGPLQYVPSTFLHYAMPGHKNVMSGYDQVLAYLNNSQYKTAAGWTSIWGSHKFDWLHSGPQGGRRFANGGIINGLTRAILGEDPLHPLEHIINTGKPSSDGLLADAISTRAKNNPSGVYAQMESLISSAHDSQKVFNTQLQTGSSLQDTAGDGKLLKQMAADMHKTAQKNINGDVYLGVHKVGNVLDKQKNQKNLYSQYFAGKLKNQGGLTNA